jgi:pentatricopeptide repeat protein
MEHKYTDALLLFSEMNHKEGCKPDDVTFQTLIHALCGEHTKDEILQLLNQLLDRES